MTFLNLSILPFIIFVFLIFSFVLYRKEKNYFTFISAHWFRKRRLSSYLSSLFYLLAWIVMSVALLDIRGPAKKIEANIPDQRTIIIIDASASMLVEDVRPNRFEKSLLLARHFVKNTAGHQIAIVLFSDTQRRLVPFTDDLDLLDARLSGMSGIDISRGGSNLGQAIQESIQYFAEQAGSLKEITGNILLFTDSEANDEGFALKIPDSVSVAAVGVGTLKGGPIPIRDKNRNFRHYKRHKGENVVSKLSEEYLRSLSRFIKNYKYWVVQSYSLPTNDILKFFKTVFQQKFEKGTITSQPVLAHYAVIPAIILFVLAFLFRIPKTAVATLAVFLCLGSVQAQQEEEKEPPPLSEKALALLDEYKSGDLEKEGKIGLADELAKLQRGDQALKIYDETVKDLSKEDFKTRFNYASLKLQGKREADGLNDLKKLRESSEANGDLEQKKLIDKTVLTYFQKKKQQQQQEKKKKEQEKKDKQKQQQQQSGDQNDQQKNKSGDQKQKKDGKQDQKDKKKDQKNSDKSDDKKDQDNDKKDQKNKNSKNDLDQKEKDIKKKRKMVKIPAILKQLLNDDRSLQKKYIDTSTDKSQQREAKDW